MLAASQKDRKTYTLYRTCWVNLESLNGRYFFCCTWGWYVWGLFRLAMFDGHVLCPSLEHNITILRESRVPQRWTKHAVAQSHTSHLHMRRAQVWFKLPSRKATPRPFVLAQNRQIPSKNLLVFSCLARVASSCCFRSHVSDFYGESPRKPQFLAQFFFEDQVIYQYDTKIVFTGTSYLTT